MSLHGPGVNGVVSLSIVGAKPQSKGTRKHRLQP